MKFTAEFGMGIKQAARLMRYDAARRALEEGHPPRTSLRAPDTPTRRT
ncbi:hypothetical protein MTP03_18260 [Tsukamurella sp. PLM1]|nr:hypothetical protein MTP03_18260 [Tsukamurella sp. PLM1]